MKWHTWVIRDKANDEVPHRIDNKSIPPHRHRCKCHVAVIEITFTLTAAPENLEVMPMQVEGMLCCVVVVKHDVHYIALAQNKGIGVCAVDFGIVGCGACRESGI